MVSSSVYRKSRNNRAYKHDCISGNQKHCEFKIIAFLMKYFLYTIHNQKKVFEF